MTTKIPSNMVSGGAEVGDFCFSHRTSKGGWLLCDASAVSRTTYADLFDEIGTTYGAGDGSTTFNVPPAGRVLVAAGVAAGLTTRAVGDEGGEETHVLTEDEMPSHEHTPTSMRYYERGSGGSGTLAGGSFNVDRDFVSSGETGGDQAHNNMPPFIAENLFIFAGV